MQRRNLVRSIALGLLAVALVVPVVGAVHEPDEATRVETPEDGRPVDYPEARPIDSPRPMPQWDGYQAGNHAELRLLYRARCGRDDLDACDVYASLLRSGVGGPPEPELALAVSSRACELGHADSCMLALAQRQRLGRPPPRLGELP
jgi:TPR repeat protein